MGSSNKPNKSDKVRRIEISQEKVRDGKGKEATRHVVRAHFHDRKPKSGKGMAGAFQSSYVPAEKSVHESPDDANDHVNDLMSRMQPDDSPY